MFVSYDAPANPYQAISNQNNRGHQALTFTSATPDTLKRKRKREEDHQELNGQDQLELARRIKSRADQLSDNASTHTLEHKTGGIIGSAREWLQNRFGSKTATQLNECHTGESLKGLRQTLDGIHKVPKQQ